MLVIGSNALRLGLIDKWDGTFPTTFMGGSNPASLLIQPPAHTPKQQ
jgi:hypothetical protein